MNILRRHIIIEVLKGSFIALILLLTLFNLFTFSDELKDIDKGEYHLKEIFYYLALTSPRVCYELIPSAALLGSLFVLGGMAQNREIIAMRAVGLSIFWIIRSVMLAGVVLVCFALFIGEFVAPNAERAAQLLKTTAQNNKVVIHSRYGIWLREGDTFINVRAIEGKSKISDVTLYKLDEKRHLKQVIHAESADFIGNQQWTFTDTQQTDFFEKKVTVSEMKTQPWNTSIVPDLLNIVVVKSENLSLFDLNNYIKFLKGNSQKSQSFEAAFWGRLFNPLVTFVMLMVSAPFVISIKRGSNTGSRLMIGIIIGMSFNILDKIIGHMGLVYHFNPILMAVLPSTLVFLGAAYAVKRVK